MMIETKGSECIAGECKNFCLSRGLIDGICSPKTNQCLCVYAWFLYYSSNPPWNIKYLHSKYAK